MKLQELRFRVNAVPAPQGSKKHVGRGRLIEVSKKVGPWRDAVKAAAKAQMTAESSQTIGEAVEVTIIFYLVRPKAHFTSRGVLKPSAPTYVINRPDIDKLVRSTLDALTDAGVFTDDSRVVRLSATKLYGAPGAEVTVTLAGPV